METISSIIINIISNVIESEIGKMLNGIKFREFKADSRVWIEEFIKKNDGTVLTTSNFEIYITYQKPIEEIYEFVLNPESKEQEETTFITKLVGNCKDSIISSGGIINVIDESIIRELFSEILNQIKNYLGENLDSGTRYNVYKSKQIGEKIITEVKQIGGQFENGIEEVKELLKKSNELDGGEVNALYNLLNEKLWNGSLDEVYNILPLVKGKSEDLEYGLKISLGIMSDYDIGIDYSWSNFQKINNQCIRDDIIRKIIFYKYENKHDIKCIIGKASSTQLNEIIQGLLDDDLEKFFSIKTEDKHGVECQEYELSKEFDEEMWIIKRICLLYLDRQSEVGIAEAMESLIKDDQNYIDNLFILEKKEIELLADYSKENDFMNEELRGILTQLKQTKNCFIHSCNIMQKKYLSILLRIMIIIEPENVSVIYFEFPERIRNEDEIQELMMQLQINNGVATENDVVNLCMRTGHYWLLNNYLVQWSGEPEKILGVLDNYKFILDKDILIYLIYLQAVRIVKGKEEASNLLLKYESNYENYLEYSLEKLKDSKDIKIAESVLEKIKNKEITSINAQSELEFIGILMYFKKYDDATEVILKYEVTNSMTPSIYRMKAGILMAQGHMIEALNIFVTIFENFQEDDYVVDNIITISLTNSRGIAEAVLNAACNIGTGRLLMLSAIAYSKNEQYNLAKKYITMALFRTKNFVKEIYGNYLGFHLKEDHNSPIDIEIADIDTTLYLKNTKTDEQRIYCIHREKLLPNEQYIWGGAIHIYKESAIQLGLLRKKIGMIIKIESDEYVISKIISLDCYLFRICVEEMVNSGNMKAFPVETKENKIINEDKFVQWIKDNSPDESSIKLIESYKDMSNIPVPIYSLAKATSLTYEQLILVLLNEKDIILRELIIPNVDLKSDGFIIAFSAIVMLYKLGVPVSLLNDKNVVISGSSMHEVKEESDIIVNNNNREHVSSMGVFNEQIFIQVSTEEQKQQWMFDAIKIQEYCQKIKTVDNYKDITIAGLEKLNIKDMFGICDYDVFSIAMETNRKIVNAEPLIMAMSRLENLKVPAIGILDFLCEIEMPVIELIECMNKMLQFRFLIIISLKAVTYISDKYIEADDSEKSRIYLLWDKFLETVDHTDDEYKKYLAQIAADVIKSEYQSDAEVRNIIWLKFSYYAMKYNGFKINVSIDANGELKAVTNKIDKE